MEDRERLEVLTENGPVLCMIVAVIEHERGEYAVLAPDDEGDDSGLFIARHELLPDGSVELTTIEDEGEYDAIHAFVEALVEGEIEP